VPAAAFGIAGNLIGSKLVVRNGNRLIKPIFVLALVLLLGRIVWDLFSR
jgi:uncharacterized membrane protein YfcA